MPSIKSLDDGNNVIYAASFSKILCPGMRLAFCACDETLAKSLVVAKQGSDVHTNVWAQRVCAELLRTMDMDAHIRAVSAMYGRKAALMAQLLQEKCPQVSFEMPQGGMFLWATLPPVAPVPEFVQACLDEKLAVIPGSAFYVDASAPCQGVRLNFSTPSEDAIRRGVDIMGPCASQTVWAKCMLCVKNSRTVPRISPEFYKSPAKRPALRGFFAQNTARRMTHLLQNLDIAVLSHFTSGALY